MIKTKDIPQLAEDLTKWSHEDSSRAVITLIGQQKNGGVEVHGAVEGNPLLLVKILSGYVFNYPEFEEIMQTALEIAQQMKNGTPNINREDLN